MEIFIRAEANEIDLIWSFMHEDENMLCPFPERKHEVLRLSDICTKRIAPNQEILKLARSLQQQESLEPKDAIHVACALKADAEYFLTCDDKLLKHARKLDTTTVIMNPVDYVRQEEAQ